MGQKHTPGPWHWWRKNTKGNGRPPNYDLAKLIGGDGSAIFTLYGGEGNFALGPNKQDIANAHLIASAPEMLDKLREVRSFLHDNAPDNLFSEITNLINKATGEA